MPRAVPTLPSTHLFLGTSAWPPPPGHLCPATSARPPLFRKWRNSGQKVDQSCNGTEKYALEGFLGVLRIATIPRQSAAACRNTSIPAALWSWAAQKAVPVGYGATRSGKLVSRRGGPLLFVPERSAANIGTSAMPLACRFVVDNRDVLNLETGSSPTRIIRKPWNLFRTEPCIAKS